MTIIPVIDLVDGQVVHARGGLRADYQPLTSALAGNSDPGAVLAALNTLYRFNRIYVADLDAIEGRKVNTQFVQTLTEQFPEHEFWLDAGPATLTMMAYLPNARLKPVISSENYGRADLAHIVRRHSEFVLSLDFRDNDLLGDPELLERGDLWPRQIIIMTLDQVGRLQGPDIDRIQALQQLSSNHDYYAAGGIRHDADLEQLAELNVAGALLATALHQQTITSFRA